MNSTSTGCDRSAASSDASPVSGAARTCRSVGLTARRRSARTYGAKQTYFRAEYAREQETRVLDARLKVGWPRALCAEATNRCRHRGCRSLSCCRSRRSGSRRYKGLAWRRRTIHRSSFRRPLPAALLLGLLLSLLQLFRSNLAALAARAVALRIRAPTTTRRGGA